MPIRDSSRLRQCHRLDPVFTTTKMLADDTKVYDNISCSICNWLQSDLISQGRTINLEYIHKNKTLFVKIILKSPIESYQPIKFATHRRTASGWKLLKVWSIDELAKTLQYCIMYAKGMAETTKQTIGHHTLITWVGAHTEWSVTAAQSRCSPSGNLATSHYENKNVNNNIWRRLLCIYPIIILLPSLATRWKQQDLCEVYKFLNNTYKTDANPLFLVIQWKEPEAIARSCLTLALGTSNFMSPRDWALFGDFLIFFFY